MTKMRAGLLAAAVLMFACAAHAATTLTLSSQFINDRFKAAMEQAAKDFEAENPDIALNLNFFDNEGFKISIRNFLTADPPDIVNWMGGNRMVPFVKAGLFEDVSDIWESENLGDGLQAGKPLVTYEDKQWGVPYSYYFWGIFYRKDIFEQHGLSEPKTWDELLHVCAVLKDAGIIPFSIGTKATFIPGGWFDFFDLRVNGYEFHRDLTNGVIPYTDPRVRKVFDYWSVLVKNGYYMPNHTSYSWQEALPTMIRGEAAMHISSVSLIQAALAAGLTEDQLGFMQFPKINPDIPLSEIAPTDTLHIPSRSKNKDAAKKFLVYMARPEVQAKFNQPVNRLAVNKYSEYPMDRYMKIGSAMLQSAHGLAQFFDRDVDAEMAKEAMDQFQRFMVQPDNIDAILKRIESARKRIYKQ